jgi:hypothetical protein
MLALMSPQREEKLVDIAAIQAAAKLDMETRWVPSSTQLEEVAAVFGGSQRERLYTVHVLVNKHYGTLDRHVKVRHIDHEVFSDRNEAIKRAIDVAMLAKVILSDGEPLTAGWTVHYDDGTWAVFEESI